jgi:hypothetical protein
MFILGPNFFHAVPDPELKRYPHQRIEYFNPKIYSKLSYILSGMFIPEQDPGSVF